MIFQVACCGLAACHFFGLALSRKTPRFCMFLHVYDTIWNLREQRKRVYEEDH